MNHVIQDRHWHLDKRVPISLIATLLVYGVTAIWFAASLSGKVEVNSQRIHDIDAVVVRNQANMSAINERLARIETQNQFNQRLLERLTDAVEKRP